MAAPEPNDATPPAAFAANPTLNRRTLLMAGAGVVAAAAASRIPDASAAGRASRPLARPVGWEQATTLGELYRRAKEEGGQLTVYAGGDTPTQQDPIKDAFLAQFPDIDLHLVVDLSKVHAARIDAQLDAGRVVVDLIELQALADFPRLKHQGSLLRYRPLGWEHVRPQFKDPDGYWTGVVVIGFANVTATSLGAAAPVEAREFLKPEFKNQLVITFPNDDDAVLFFFSQLVSAYGWDFMAKLVAQNPTFIRGTAASAGAVYDGSAEASFGTFSGLQAAPGATALFTVPKRSPWVAWAQRAAIMSAARHPAAARLYLSWLLSKPAQSSGQTWSPRADIAPPTGYRSILDYPNMDPTAFEVFLSDERAVDRFRAQIQLYVGDVVGPSPTGVLGIYPGAF